MLVDEAGCPSPLEADQGLYYFRQLLLGVKFLHDSNVLHLDIKGLNLLVFDEGKTLKLCDFGTAVRMDDMAASGGRKNCMTPLFATPEVSDNSNLLVRYFLWASEASPALGCSIEISRDIYIYICCRYVCRMSN